jgi:hypothetical protein
MVCSDVVKVLFRLSPTSHFGNAKPHMQCVNRVCIAMQKISSPTGKRQNLIEGYCYLVHMPLVRRSLACVECVDEGECSYLLHLSPPVQNDCFGWLACWRQLPCATVVCDTQIWFCVACIGDSMGEFALQETRWWKSKAIYIYEKIIAFRPLFSL